MADLSVTPTRADVTLADLLRQIDAIDSQIRAHIDLLRSLRQVMFAQPVAGWTTPDPYQCEICGQPVAACDLSGYAKRHGAICHSRCLTVEMDSRF